MDKKKKLIEIIESINDERVTNYLYDLVTTILELESKQRELS